MTIEGIYQERMKKVLEAEFTSICNPTALEGLVVGGVTPGSRSFEISDLALRVRLTQESVKSVARLEETLRSTSEAASSLQLSANKLSNRVFWLTLAILALTVLQVLIAAFTLFRSGH